jgi:hypothetical protein
MRLTFGALLVVGVLALSACGIGGGKAKPTATPDAAQIVSKVKGLQFKDATFTVTLNFTTSGQTINGTGSGKITKSPDRSDIQFAFPLNVSGQSYNVQIEVITDGTTSYTMLSGIPGLDTNGKWTKGDTGSSSSSNPFGNTSQFSDFANALGSPTLVGTDTINGVAVYHLKGSDTSSSGGTVDMYVRTDNYQPVKADFTETGSTPGTFSLVFTAWNSGISISTPSPDQIASGS